ncbi:MAG: M16 family metallopeptidase, partial [Bacteroidales bacterium]
HTYLLNMRNKMYYGGNRLLRFCAGAFVFTLFQVPQAQASDLLLRKAITNDSTVVYGKLENGLTYYVKNNKTNPGQIAYSLLVKAGSIDEDASQRGLSHFNEHLSFQGTPSFAKGIMDGSFIPGIDKKQYYTNALTTQTETVYTLILPDVRETLADTALILFKEWLSADFDSEAAIKKESEIIAREWLDFQDVSERGRKKWYPVFYNDTKWAYSQSIGELEVITKADPKEIARYRKEWYRPDLAAVTIVGDVDPAAMVARLKACFGGVAPRGVKREREDLTIPERKTRQSVVYTDMDQQFSFFSIYHRRENPDLNTEEGVKLSLKYALLNRLMTGRMFEIQEENSGIVSYLAASSYLLMKPDWIYAPSASVVNGKMREALRLVAREQERIVQHGFLNSEFTKAKATLKKKYEQEAQYGHSRANLDWAKTFENHFLTNAPYALPSKEADVYLQVLESITAEEMKDFHADMWDERNSTVVIAVPEADFASAPDENEVLELLKAAKLEKLEPFVETDMTKPLFEVQSYGKPGTVKKRVSLSELPVYKYTLSNGAEVVFFNDSTKSGEILFEAVSRGGKSLLTADQAEMADLACMLYNEGPVGNYSYNQFQRYMSKSPMRMSISVANETEGVKGSVATASFEQLMQRMYMLFHHLELPAEKYQELLNGKKDRYLALQGTNESRYEAFIGASLAGRTPDAALGEVSLGQLEGLLKARFASPSDFTFYFTGALQEVDFERLTAQYLGGGKKMKREKFGKRYETRLQGDHAFVFRKGSDERAVVQYMIGAPYEMNMDNMSLLQAMNPMISKRLSKKIREELHLVYDIRSELKLKSTPEPRADFVVSFNCNPEDVMRIAGEIRKVFEEFAAQGPEELELNGIRTQMLSSKRRFETDNGFRLGCIRSHDQSLNNDYAKQINNIAFIGAMSGEEIRRMLTELLGSKAVMHTVFSLEAEK